MTQVNDSVFVGITDHIGHQRVLMVRRRCDRQFWLPGGKRPETGSVDIHADEWLKLLFCCGTITIEKMVAGPWKLSNNSLAYLVSARIHGLADLDGIDLQVRDGFENEYITGAAALSLEDIHHHLYTAKDMPWGQAKMALWAMYSESLKVKYGDQKHRPLKEDIGWFDNYTWIRPQ